MRALGLAIAGMGMKKLAVFNASAAGSLIGIVEPFFHFAGFAMYTIDAIGAEKTLVKSRDHFDFAIEMLNRGV